MEAMAYVNWGRVIVDCPGCPAGLQNAYLVDSWSPRNRTCDDPNEGCGAAFTIVMPDNIGEIMQELSRRPNMENRNWFPEGHPMAVHLNEPMGQTVADLAAEFALAREGKL